MQIIWRTECSIRKAKAINERQEAEYTHRRTMNGIHKVEWHIVWRK